MDERLSKLVELLLTRTKQGQVAWRKGLGQGEFTTSFADFSVEIDETPRRMAPVVRVSIFNSEGELIDSFSSEDIVKTDRTETARQMEELYRLARRKALGADEALEHILESLEKAPG